METSASCTTVETGEDCQKFVNENPKCRSFTAKFEWEACHLEPMFMKVLSEASNVKIARKFNGRTTNDRIDRVGNLGAAGSYNNCEKFGPQLRSYNTCSNEGNVFFSVNVQGTKPNGKYWYECQSYKFNKIVFHPEPVSPPAGAPSKGKGGKGRRNLEGGRRRTRIV